MGRVCKEKLLKEEIGLNWDAGKLAVFNQKKVVLIFRYYQPNFYPLKILDVL